MFKHLRGAAAAAMQLLGLFTVIGVLGYLLTGCSPPACYDAIGINPPARFAIVFNHCTGEVEYRNLPPLPMERARPEISFSQPVPTTTSTTTTQPRQEI